MKTITIIFLNIILVSCFGRNTTAGNNNYPSNEVIENTIEVVHYSYYTENYVYAAVEIFYIPSIAEKISKVIADRGFEMPFRGRWWHLSDEIENVTSIDYIRSSSGFYIQQESRTFQGGGRTPEILKLFVEDEIVFIHEIDIINDGIKIKNVIQLEFNGITYVYNRTRLQMINGNIFIVYLENTPVTPWYGRNGGWWEEDAPYTFAGNLNSSIPDIVFRLTTDYLLNFTGQYIFDSYIIMNNELETIVDINSFKNAVIEVGFDKKNKHLTMSTLQSWQGWAGRQVNFVETQAKEPFWWTFSEGGFGSSEQMFFFYDDGIVFIYQQGFQGRLSDTGVRPVRWSLRYVLFFRKK